ncbi:MAG: FHA domain-containing protein [Chitinispirillales bacterium]|jgi:pSer/pThr/pTyr-binding forkhead associated (FHA) protein|nr:FHA domain-containing protein [Chitinispirillales bacterium]
MIRYTVYFNGEQVKVYDIEDPVIFIGRLPENQIPIFNMGISRRHVKIELDAYGAYTLTDLNSLNGTLVNGKKVKRATLVNGDKITIGKYTIVYEDLRGEAALHLETIVAEFRPEDMQRQAQPPFTPPQFALPQAAPLPQAMPAPQHPLPVMPAPQATPAPQAMPTFQAAPVPGAQTDDEALSGAVLIETAGHVVYKLDHEYLTIGTAESDDIYAAGFMVNKGFATIEKRDGGFYITVQKMMAKIKVNGKSVRTHRLEHRDRIEIGSNTFRFMENG